VQEKKEEGDRGLNDLIANYLDDDDIEDKRRSTSPASPNLDAGAPALQPSLFNGIIHWSIIHLEPSYYIQESKAKTEIDSHFLDNNSTGAYPESDMGTVAKKKMGKGSKKSLTFDLLYNNLDVYYNPPHEPMANFKDYNKTNDDCASGAGYQDGYTLSDVRPVNSIIAHNLSSALLELCGDARFLPLLFDSDVLQALVVKYEEEQAMSAAGGTLVTDRLHRMALNNVRRSARVLLNSITLKCEKVALSIVRDRAGKEKQMRGVRQLAGTRERRNIRGKGRDKGKGKGKSKGTDKVKVNLSLRSTSNEKKVRIQEQHEATEF